MNLVLMLIFLVVGVEGSEYGLSIDRGSLSIDTGGQQESNCLHTLKLDIEFLLDSSSSIGYGEFRFGLEFVQTFVSKFAQQHPIGGNGTRFGMVQYNGITFLEFYLSRHDDLKGLLADIADTEYITGVTLTGKAIEIVANSQFRDSRGNRPDAPNIIIILTDGWSQSYIPSAVEDAMGRGVDIFVVGMGGNLNYRELLMLADGRGEHIFELPSVYNRTLDADYKTQETVNGVITRLRDIYAYRICGIVTASPDESTTTLQPTPLITTQRPIDVCRIVDCVNYQDVPIRTDVAFLIDTTNTVTYRNFQGAMTFAKDVTKHFDVLGPCDTQIGVVQFSTLEYLELPFNKHFPSTTELLAELDRVRYSQGINWSDRSSYNPIGTLFQAKSGLRPGVPQILVVLTDGWGRSDVESAVFDAARRGVSVFVVGLDGPRGLNDYRLLRMAQEVSQNTFTIPHADNNSQIATYETRKTVKSLVNLIHRNSQSYFCGSRKPETGFTTPTMPPLPTRPPTATPQPTPTTTQPPTPSITPTQRPSLVEWTRSTASSKVTTRRTTQPATPPSPPPTSPHRATPQPRSSTLRDCSLLDVVFLLDSSSSINTNNHGHLLRFMEAIIGKFKNLGAPYGAQFGMVQYSSQPYIEFYMNRHKDKTSLIRDIQDTEYMKGATYTARAIDSTVNNVFTSIGGDRRDAPNVIIIITDGWAQDDIETSAWRAYRRGMELFAVGVAPDYDYRHLEELALTNRERIVTLSAYDNFTTEAVEHTEKAIQKLSEQLEILSRDACRKIGGGGVTSERLEFTTTKKFTFPVYKPTTGSGGQVLNSTVTRFTPTTGITVETPFHRSSLITSGPSGPDSGFTDSFTVPTEPTQSTPNTDTDKTTPPGAFTKKPTRGTTLGLSTDPDKTIPPLTPLPDNLTPSIDCLQDGFTFKIPTDSFFNGFVYIKGKFGTHRQGEAECMNDHDNNAGKFATIAVNSGSCGIQRIRTRNPPGVEIVGTVVVMHGRVFIQKGDRAFKVRCFYQAEFEKSVSQSISIPGVIPTETIDISEQMPSCQYSLRQGSRNGPSVRYTEVGTQIYHRWDCEENHEGTYGMLVHSCVVANDEGSKSLQIIDETGCVMDGAIMEQLVYPTQGLSVHTRTRAFGFADAETMQFTCRIRFCVKAEGGCDGITPPNCQFRVRRKKRESGREVVVEETLDYPDNITSRLTVVDFFDHFFHVQPQSDSRRSLPTASPSAISRDFCLSKLAVGSVVGAGLLASSICVLSSVILVRKNRPRNWDNFT